MGSVADCGQGAGLLKRVDLGLLAATPMSVQAFAADTIKLLDYMDESCCPC